jgi:hypothetical protein
VGLGSTQPLAETSTKNLPGCKGRPSRKTGNLTAIYEPIVLENEGASTSHTPLGLRPVRDSLIFLLPLIFTSQRTLRLHTKTVLLRGAICYKNRMKHTCTAWVKFRFWRLWEAPWFKQNHASCVDGFKQLHFCEIWGSHSDGYEEYCELICYTSCLSTFRRDILPVST